MGWAGLPVFALLRVLNELDADAVAGLKNKGSYQQSSFLIALLISPLRRSRYFHRGAAMDF